MATQIIHTGGSAAASACSPQVICVGPNGQFQTINDALASITDEGPTKQYNIHVSPGIYTEDVVLRRWINLCGCSSFGPELSTVIEGTGPTTLQIPQGDVVVSHIAARINSANATDAALRVVDDGDPTPTLNPPFMVYYVSQAFGGARGTSIETAGLITITGGHDAYDMGVGVHLDPGTLYFHLGAGGVGVNTNGVNPGSSRGIESIDGFVLLSGGCSVGADQAAGTAIYAYSENGQGLMVEEAVITDALNGVELADDGNQPGVNAFLGGLTVRGGIGAGVPLRVGARSTAYVTPETRINNFGDTPLQGWVVNGSVVRQPDATWGLGLAQAPGDQRPTAVPPPVGYKYWATDTAIGGGPGGGVELTWTGLGWVDTAGNPVP